MMNRKQNWQHAAHCGNWLVCEKPVTSSFPPASLIVSRLIQLLCFLLLFSSPVFAEAAYRVECLLRRTSFMFIGIPS